MARHHDQIARVQVDLIADAVEVRRRRVRLHPHRRHLGILVLEQIGELPLAEIPLHHGRAMVGRLRRLILR